MNFDGDTFNLGKFLSFVGQIFRRADVGREIGKRLCAIHGASDFFADLRGFVKRQSLMTHNDI